MSAKRLQPECEFEEASAADVLDGLRTLSGTWGSGVLISPRGDGPDNPLSWAIQEVSSAARLTPGAERDQLCTNAVLNARRSLACLVDWYLERDLGTYCKNPPKTPGEQARFLVRRGIIDELTSAVLERAIGKRNKVEHEYVAPDLETAEDIVELLRRTMTALRGASEPSHAPLIFGMFDHANGFRESGPYAHFYGWCGPLAVFCRFSSQPWIGLVLPTDSTRANVRRAFLSGTTDEELTELLSLAEHRYGHPSSFQDVRSSEVLVREMGLIGNA